MNYGTNACQNKWSSIMVFFPPSWVTATNLQFGFLLVWWNLREIFKNTVILTSYMGMIHVCNHFLVNYFFKDYCRINPILVLNDWPLRHERFTFREWFNGWAYHCRKVRDTDYFFEQRFIYNFCYIHLHWIAQWLRYEAQN